MGKSSSISSNLIISFLSKISGLIASFLMIPILLKSIGVEQYGLWVTISSVAAWLMFFDFGLGNSFKNIVSTATKEKTLKEYNLAFSLYVYVAIVLVLSSTLFILTIDEEKVKIIALLYLPLSVLFPLRLFSFGLQGLRLVGLNSFFETLRIFIWLFFALYYVYFHNGDELYVLSLIFVLANIIPHFLQFIAFKAKCGFSLKPNIISPKAIFKEDSFRTGIRFFIIQLSSLVSFNLGNVLIYNNFGSSQVAQYDIFNKVFVAALSVFNMSIAVMWPEISKAYANKDFLKCKKYYNTLLFIAIVFCFCFIILAFNFDILLMLLKIDGVLALNFDLLVGILILTCLQALAYCGAVVLNATNKLKMQIWLAIASILLIYPLFQVLVYLGFGVSSYPYATGVMVFAAAIIYNYLANQMFKVGSQ